MGLESRLPTSAIAVRGYNITNLGRSPELLAHDAYGPIIRSHLEHAGDLCNSVTGRSTDLVKLVQDQKEPGLDLYAEAIAIISAIELAQFQICRELHGINLFRANCAFGYSLGELIAAAAAGAFDTDSVLRIPLAMAEDCAELARDTTMAIVFTRGAALDEDAVHEVCENITCEGEGMIGVSAVLSPNTMLILGQGNSVSRLKQGLRKRLARKINIRLNGSKWPPLHSPLVRAKHVPDRAAMMMSQVPLSEDGPQLPVISLVTGRKAYHDRKTRSLLRDWSDKPQRLWDVVGQVFSRDVNTLVHIGPEPNVIPATFRRLADNVRQSTGAWSLESLGIRAVQKLAQRPWLASLLPQQSNLLRAPKIRHIVLENWLLRHPPK